MALTFNSGWMAFHFAPWPWYDILTDSTQPRAFRLRVGNRVWRL